MTNFLNKLRRRSGKGNLPIGKFTPAPSKGKFLDTRLRKSFEEEAEKRRNKFKASESGQEGRGLSENDMKRFLEMLQKKNSKFMKR